jgi:DNA-binding GntR family transcriptional regulator
LDRSVLAPTARYLLYIRAVNGSVFGTSADFVADELRRRIITGELAAGARLRQTEVANQFAVSTTPVREALASLAREGFVRRDPHRGVVVFRPTLAEIRENYEIRLALEPLATEFAAETIGQRDLVRIAAIHDALSQKVIEPRRATELNRDFHSVIYAASGRAQLLAMIDRLRDAADAFLSRLAADSSPDYEALVHEHAAIVAALRSHAPRRAHKAMTLHLQHSLATISSFLHE